MQIIIVWVATFVKASPQTPGFNPRPTRLFSPWSFPVLGLLIEF